MSSISLELFVIYKSCKEVFIPLVLAPRPPETVTEMSLASEEKV